MVGSRTIQLARDTAEVVRSIFIMRVSLVHAAECNSGLLLLIQKTITKTTDESKVS